MTSLYIHWNIDPVLVDLGFTELRYYSILFVGGLVLAAYIVRRMFAREGLNPDLIYTLAFYVLIGTVVGARLGHCLFYEPEHYLTHPLEIILPIAKDASGSWHFAGYKGLASHGGIIGVLVAAYIFVRKKKLSYLWMLDRIAIVGALAGCFIRVGNFFNSEIIGQPSTLPWAVVFEWVDDVARHPAQLYEALAYLAIFGLLMWIYKQKRAKLQNGFLLGLFLILLFTARFFIEFLKERQVDFESGMILDMGQLLSIPFILVGVVLVYLKWPKKKNSL